MKLLDWVLRREPVYIPNWTSHRVKKYERDTFNYLGIFPELLYPWSWQFRPPAVSSDSKSVLRLASKR